MKKQEEQLESPVAIYPTEPPAPMWLFREEFYEKKLLESLPIDNYLQWCYDTLQKEEKGPIDQHKFFKMVDLLFKGNISAQYMPKTHTVNLEDVNIKFPHINVKLRDDNKV